METYKGELIDSIVEINIEYTKSWYSKGSLWGCECRQCRNFLELASKKQLPQQILEILDGFGILPEQATYVCHLYDNDKGHLYQFSYRLAGFMLSDEKNTTKSFDWGGARCCHETYPYGAPDFPEPHFDIEFYATLPWILEETQN